jgi:hypothetical protein
LLFKFFAETDFADADFGALLDYMSSLFLGEVSVALTNNDDDILFARESPNAFNENVINCLQAYACLSQLALLKSQSPLFSDFISNLGQYAESILRSLLPFMSNSIYGVQEKYFLHAVRSIMSCHLLKAANMKPTANLKVQIDKLAAVSSPILQDLSNFSHECVLLLFLPQIQ